MRNYTRWIRSGERLQADILSNAVVISAHPEAGHVVISIAATRLAFSPDEARLYGVRLIEAAALADGERAIRDEPKS